VWTAVVRVDHGTGPDVVTSAAATTLTNHSGTRVAVSGDHLTVGDVLVTGAAGRASLDVPGGRLVLGPSTALRILGPRLSELLRGTAGVRLMHSGPALSVQTGTVTASVAQVDAGARIVRDYQVSVAALAGGADLAGLDGADLPLPALAQAVVPGVVLPASSLPVQSLDHDPHGVDAALAPALVDADAALDRLAAQIDADSVARTTLAPASYELSALPAATSHPSEIALTRAIGQASAGDHVTDTSHAVTLRAEGAAWGVVAADLHVTPDQLRPILEQMLAAPTLRALVPPIATEAAGPRVVTTSPAPAPAPRSTTSSGAHRVSPTPASPAPLSPAPTSPAAPPSSDPIGQIVSILGPSPSPLPSPLPSDLFCPIIGLLGLC
jgi:hypothetical protein